MIDLFDYFSYVTIVGNHVFIAQGAILCGNCRVEDGAFVGTGSTIMLGVTVGAGSTIGAGATVLRSVNANSVVAGVPALEIT